MNQWINEWMNESMNQSINGYSSFLVLFDQCLCLSSVLSPHWWRRSANGHHQRLSHGGGKVFRHARGWITRNNVGLFPASKNATKENVTTRQSLRRPVCRRDHGRHGAVLPGQIILRELRSAKFSGHKINFSFPHLLIKIKFSASNQIIPSSNGIFLIFDFSWKKIFLKIFFFLKFFFRVFFVGDSIGVLCRLNPDGGLNVNLITVLHNIDSEDEALRLSLLGLNVDDVRKTMGSGSGSLKLTRCIGNYALKRHYQKFPVLQ